MIGEKKKSISLLIAIIASVCMLITGVVLWMSYRWVPTPENTGVATGGKPVIIDTEALLAPLKKPAFTGTIENGRKGFYLSASDLIQKSGMADAAIAARIDAILATMKKYDFNALTVETDLDGRILYNTESVETNAYYGVDVLEMLREKANAAGITLYVVYDCGLTDDETKSEILLQEFVQKYAVDGILLDGYYAAADSSDYAGYMLIGGGTVYGDFLRSRSEKLIDNAVKTVREIDPTIPVGLLTDPVWQVKSNIAPEGIDAKTAFQTYTGGYADVRRMIEERLVDFVCVRAGYSMTDANLKFTTLLDWWNTLAKETETPLFFIQAGENVCTAKAGWSGTDQLVRQLSTAVKASEYYGSFFSGYDRIVSDPRGSTSALLKFYANEYSDANLFKDLTVTSPTKTSQTVYEDKIVFRGKYDPQFEVTINGKKILPTKEGEFYETYDLKIGTNQFVISHKGQQKTYTVVRKVKVFHSVTPTGKLEIDGGTSIYVEAVVYRGSSITATWNGKTIALKEVTDGEENRDSAYARYVGTFVAPAAKTKAQSLGSIRFKATYKNSTETKTGASVVVRKSDLDFDPTKQVIVTSSYAEVCDPNNTDPYPSAEYYGLPKGTIDYIDKQGKIGNQTFYYLHSGKRVYPADVKAVTGVYHGNNALESFSFSEDELNTTLKIKQKWKAPFNITFSDVEFYTGSADHHYYVKDFTSDTVIITFDYATQAEAVSKELLKDITMFSDIRLEKIKEGVNGRNIDRYRLSLKLSKKGRYYGCYAEYDKEGSLVLRFNHLQQTLKGVRVFLDPGHGGSDPGAIVKYVEDGHSVILHEADANLAMVQKLAKKLEAEGAIVGYLTEKERERYKAPNGLPERYKAAQRFQADILLSIHCNSTGGAGANGTEAWYTTPFSMPLAREISKAVSKEAGLTLRNGGAHNNRFAVNRGRTFPSVLVETAFISNPSDREKLFSDAGREKITDGILKGIQNYLKLNS